MLRQWNSIGTFAVIFASFGILAVSSYCSNGILLDPLLHHSFLWYSNGSFMPYQSYSIETFAVIIPSICIAMFKAVSMITHWILSCYHSFHWHSNPLVFPWFLHAASIPMVVHWIFCILSFLSIVFPLLLSLIHAATMVYTVGSFVVIIYEHSMQCH